MIIELLIIILFLSLVFGNKHPSEYLYCGLFGWVGKHPANFSRHAFTILGLHNETRGGDSCGIYSNREIKYGTGFSKDFPTFIKKISRVKAGKDCVVLGHTRKASVGAATAKNAQPVVLMNDAGSPGFILTHNGTLINHFALAKKYGLSTKNLNTDSQILAALLYNTKASNDILLEYNGTAVLVFHLVGTNSIFIFKGESRNTSNFAYSSEERPLYGYQESENSFYYSSVKNPLEMIARDAKNIFDIKCNILYEVTAGVVSEVRKIDREDKHQRFIEPYKKTVNNYNYDSYNDNVWDRSHRRVTGFYDDDKTKWLSPHESITAEPLVHLGDCMISYTRGRFHLGENLVHGKVIVNEYGLLLSKTKGEVFTYDLYFWEGILLYGEENFTKLVEKKKKIKSHFISSLDEDILDGGPYPVAVYNTKDIRAALYEFNDASSGTYDTFTGKFNPIFSNREYTISGGLVHKVTTKGSIKKIFSTSIKLINTWN